MMVNPDVDDCAKTQINGKYSEKRKNQQPTKKTIKRILKPKYHKLSGGVVFTFSWPRELSPLFPPASYSTATNALNND